jgi:hypothetical protein
MTSTHDGGDQQRLTCLPRKHLRRPKGTRLSNSRAARFRHWRCAIRNSIAAPNAEAATAIRIIALILARRRQYRCHWLAETRHIPPAALLEDIPSRRSRLWGMSAIGPSRHPLYRLYRSISGIAMRTIGSTCVHCPSEKRNARHAASNESRAASSRHWRSSSLTIAGRRRRTPAELPLIDIDYPEKIMNGPHSIRYAN